MFWQVETRIHNQWSMDAKSTYEAFTEISGRDANSAYWQSVVSETAKEKTALTLLHRRYGHICITVFTNTIAFKWE